MSVRRSYFCHCLTWQFCSSFLFKFPLCHLYRQVVSHIKQLITKTFLLPIPFYLLISLTHNRAKIKETRLPYFISLCVYIYTHIKSAEDYLVSVYTFTLQSQVQTQMPLFSNLLLVCCKLEIFLPLNSKIPASHDLIC